MINRTIEEYYFMNAKKKVSKKVEPKVEIPSPTPYRSPVAAKKDKVNIARAELQDKPINMSTMLKLLIDSDMSVWDICRWTGLSPTLFEDIDDDEEIDPRVRIKLNKLSVRQGLGVEL
jgi:hypothetical protein